MRSPNAAVSYSPNPPKPAPQLTAPLLHFNENPRGGSKLPMVFEILSRGGDTRAPESMELEGYTMLSVGESKTRLAPNPAAALTIRGMSEVGLYHTRGSGLVGTTPTR